MPKCMNGSHRMLEANFFVSAILRVPMPDSPSRNSSNAAYWRANLLIVGVLLAIWFVVSYLCGIVFVEALNRVTFFGFKLGFWFAQQGSIYIFVALIFIYVFLMNRLDRKFGVDETGEHDRLKE